MKYDIKNIHIGSLIKQAVTERGIEMSRICKFFGCTSDEILEMYEAENLYSDIILKWSKLLDYDFFRIYTQDLILFSPPTSSEVAMNKSKSSLPQFRKNIYTVEVIHFILEQIATGEMTKLQVIERYRIPKTTLYKWISKY